jgi:outer membrane protein
LPGQQAPAVEQAPATQQTPAPPAPAPAARQLTLGQALAMARVRKPALREARAATEGARARVDQARAPLFPQLEASASYQKTTANFAARPGSTPQAISAADDPDFDLYDYFSFSVGARQLLYDFGGTWDRAEAAEASQHAQEHSERAALLSVEEQVRVNFFAARAAKALVAVAHETLRNYEQHLAQIEAFVRAGTRAEIDLAQARTDRANARVDVINAENGYAAGKARLNEAIGIEGGTDYDVTDENLSEVEGEDGPSEQLVRRAIAQRPELAALTRELRAQELTASSIEGTHWPALSAFTNASEAGIALDALAWNWNAGVSLDWALFQGGVVSARAGEARAQLAALRARLDGARQQVRLEVEQARLSVRAAKAVIAAAEEAMVSAREQLRLAEGRYQAGVGSVLELGDAQLAMAAASAQRVRADYDLSSARARLMRVLGR